MSNYFEEKRRPSHDVSLKENRITLESIREKALKLIPDSFDEKDLKGLLVIAKKLGNLTDEERFELLEEIEVMSPEEIVERLEQGSKYHKIVEK